MFSKISLKFGESAPAVEKKSFAPGYGFLLTDFFWQNEQNFA